MRHVRRRLLGPVRLGVVFAVIGAIIGSGIFIWVHGSDPQAPVGKSWLDPRHGKKLTGAYAYLATQSIRLLENSFYNGNGLWHMCVGATCNTKNFDWGADALTNVLWFRWQLTGDQSVLYDLRGLIRTAHNWGGSAVGSSDTAMWDSVAELREYQATGSAVALAKAKAAFRWVDSVNATVFGTGACPRIDYQWAYGHRTDLKTLETGSNYVKTAILLYMITHDRAYLTKAKAEYRISRHYFLSPGVPLYTDYIQDNGTTCAQLPDRYFASVNGNMIWAGAELAKLTGKQAYLYQAVATAKAVQTHLSDGTGVFTDMLADNDIVEPLIEGMYVLATQDHRRSARNWLLTAASAAGSDANSLGEFGRFFNGPAPTSLATAWQMNGGVALMNAAAALDPGGGPADPRFWQHAAFIADSRQLSSAPLRIAFTARAIAIMGTVGEVCCGSGHARVLIDGVETFDHTGIWQNKTSPAIQQFDQVLFAWRWPTAGHHTVTILPGAYNAIEGGSFFHMSGYLLKR